VIDSEELGAWLRLLETPGVGRESARRLLAAFGSPQAVIAASIDARREVVGPTQARALADEPDGLAKLCTTTLDWLRADAAETRDVIAIGDPRYPSALLNAPDPPLMLYAQGRIALLQAESIAIVGSRHPTPQGAANARAFARELSRAGLTIVSGMALGVDAAAHDGGLDGAGSTIAVIGTGLDRVYPRRNLALAHRIAREGLIFSEYALGTPPLAANFPQRNRIIAGLSGGTLVVEAALQSGSLITARLANEAGREVFAIPGSIHSPQARGCHALLRQGAKLVETAQDVLEELHPTALAAASPASAETADSDPLLAALGFDPVTLDALAARTGLGAAELSARLLGLELDGQIARLPGQLFQRVAGR
jgi:DNA processing protein